MAQLHRRVLRFSYSQGLAALVALLLAEPAAAQEEITKDTLVEWAEDLREGDEDARAQAFERLSTLPASALGAMAERLEESRRQEIPEEDGYDALRWFRHATGSRRADDDIDISVGVLDVLKDRRSRDVTRTAERLAYLRSIERLGTLEAQRHFGDVLRLTPTMWRWERQRIVRRMGARALPGLLVSRKYPSRSVRHWARWGVDELNMQDPAEALQIEEPELLADVIRAYGEVRDMDAMPVIISFVGSDDDRVRQAARASMERYGRNAIWQFRRAFRTQLGEEAELSRGWRRTMDELYERLDDKRLGPLNETLNQAIEALESSDFDRALAGLDEVLLHEPEHPKREMIAGAYGQLADAASDGGQLDEAMRLWRRASRIDPSHPQADRWNAALLIAEAERDRASGFFDAEAYREANRLDPSHPVARDVVAQLLGEETVAEPADESSTSWGSYALVLCLLGLLGLGYRQRASLTRWLKVVRKLQRSQTDGQLADSERAEAAQAPKRAETSAHKPQSLPKSPVSTNVIEAPSTDGAWLLSPAVSSSKIIEDVTTDGSWILGSAITDASQTIPQPINMMPESSPGTLEAPDTIPGA